ncbi:hypothetical protein Pan153_24330 [Gimesia panareensis]|uniref:YdhG-like domain-containing protein n=1 Tax=Gimesia panareensis TaxID=2527978 RepID=A0A518FN48_9PLAN|nr:YdeI/OmpD-associated family protein [Gimesia panareensis]QDV17778.1 hypothetical protein Pan153_24330 [Gimesia panareensis]
MKKKNPAVDAYFSKLKNWQKELTELRKILLNCPLTEELKWRNPCYTFQKSNVIITGCFKDCCSLSFFKGVLLKDPRKILSKPGENTRAGRLVRFTSLQEIIDLKPTLQDYITEAIELEHAGSKVDLKQEAELDVPDELQQKLKANAALKKAFAALTPGRQRAYLLHFSAARQSKTRVARIEKYTQQILDGKGLNDCTCGLSHKLPRCDGSHKSLR